MKNISIITACKASESLDYINQLIESVESQGRDTLTQCEWIWVINGDNCINIANHISRNVKLVDFHIILSEIALTPGKARNLAIMSAKGEFICIQDSDDLMLRNRLVLQVKMLKFYNADVIYTPLIHFKDGKYESPANTFNDTTLNDKVKILNNIRLAFHCTPRNPSAFIRKSVFIRSSYHPSLIVSEDYYLWCDIVSNGGKIICLNAPLVAYRIDDSFYSRRVGLRYFTSDYLVKMHYITSTTKFPHLLASLFSTITSVHRLLPIFIFSRLYRFINQIKFTKLSQF